MEWSNAEFSHQHTDKESQPNKKHRREMSYRSMQNPYTASIQANETASGIFPATGTWEHLPETSFAVSIRTWQCLAQFLHSGQLSSPQVTLQPKTWPSGETSQQPVWVLMHTADGKKVSSCTCSQTVWAALQAREQTLTITRTPKPVHWFRCWHKEQ